MEHVHAHKNKSHMFRRTSCRSWKVAQGDIMYEFCLHLNADRLGWTNWWPEPQRCTPSTRAHRHVHARTRTCASRRQVNQRYREPGESNAQGMGLGVGGLGERGQVATYLLTRSIDPLSSKGGWGRRGVCIPEVVHRPFRYSYAHELVLRR